MYKFRWLTRHVRKLPAFIIAGPPRSGTTSLYHFFNKHPDIQASPIKELDFFNTSRFSKGLAWYRLFFPLKTDRCIGFEASPHYFSDLKALFRIKLALPDVKIIILKRKEKNVTASWIQLSRIHYRKKGMIANEELALDQVNFAKYTPEWQKHFNTLVVSSEKLFNNDVTEKRKIFAFIGVKFVDIEFPWHNELLTRRNTNANN